MDIERIELSNWQQFGSVSIDFDSRATVITGANGCGKTTLLSLLARHTGISPASLATPKFSPILSDETHNVFYDPAIPSSHIFHPLQPVTRHIGKIYYSDGTFASLSIPATNNPLYHVNFSTMREIDILYIPSHRQLFNYKRTPNLLTQKMERKAVFSEYKNATDSLYTGHHYGEPVSFLMKNALLSWAINGYGVTDNNSNTIMQADVSQAENFEGFRNVLKTLLPESLGFENLSIRDYEIIFSCNNGRDEFLLENASGGIAALIDIAWRIFNFNVSSDHPFFVMIDEAENHLHPSMQRSLLPKLLTAFPHIKFIITTHSPLIVTSIEDASIYVLKHNSQQKIESLKLNASKEVCNIIEILDQILGVSTTIPIWASKKFNSILEQHLSKDITKDSISALRSELETAGLSRLFPNAIGTIAESRE